MQCKGLALGEPPYGSWYLLSQVSMLGRGSSSLFYPVPRPVERLRRAPCIGGRADVDRAAPRKMESCRAFPAKADQLPGPFAQDGVVLVRPSVLRTVSGAFPATGPVRARWSRVVVHLSVRDRERCVPARNGPKLTFVGSCRSEPLILSPFSLASLMLLVNSFHLTPQTCL